MSFLRFLVGFFFLLFASGGAGYTKGPTVHLITIDDEIINPITAEYIEQGIDQAHEEGAECLILQLDTPGGLLNSTRRIVKTIMKAPLPVIVYVAPSSARAGSAGVFITLASDIAVMAPTTHIGAAHPVNVGGGDRKSLEKLTKAVRGRFSNEEQEEEEGGEKSNTDFMADKITNDTVAWVRNIASARGRNKEWAERAVRESISSPADEALKEGVIDLIAPDVGILLEQIDGRKIKRIQGKVLQTRDAMVKERPLSTRQKLLLVLTNPNIAYLLMMLGFYGLLFEVTHPGIGVPGVAGLICLILALFAFQTLPINYAGVALIALAIILFIAETQVASFGLLTLGGLVSMLLGSLMLIDSPFDFLRVSIWVILPMVLSTGLVTIVLLSLVVRAHQRKSAVGSSGLIGQTAIARSRFGPGRGKVDLHGEIWNAQVDARVQRGESLTVISIKGLTVVLQKRRK